MLVGEIALRIHSTCEVLLRSQPRPRLSFSALFADTAFAISTLRYASSDGSRWSGTGVFCVDEHDWGLFWYVLGIQPASLWEQRIDQPHEPAGRWYPNETSHKRNQYQFLKIYHAHVWPLVRLRKNLVERFLMTLPVYDTSPLVLFNW
jgi:hypothetical protein